MFLCTECGNTTPKWAGKCPFCGAWSTLRESIIEDSIVPGSDLNIKLKIQNVGFGNTVAQYDSAKCGNYIGEFVVSKKAKSATNAIAGIKSARTPGFTLQGNRLQVHNATHVEIFDLIGNRVLEDTQAAATQTLSLDRLGAGTFLVRLSDGTRQRTARILLK